MDGWMDGWMDDTDTGGMGTTYSLPRSPEECLSNVDEVDVKEEGGWVDGWMGGWVDEWVDGGMGGWVGGWMSGWMGGWVGG